MRRACPCGSGRRFRLCCGRDAESLRVLGARLTATADLMALATLTPRLRPDSPAFDAWASAVGPVADHPLEALLDAGVEVLGPERRRIAGDAEELCGSLWHTLRGLVPDAERLLLRGAVLAGLREREPVPVSLLAAAGRCGDPVRALATALDPTDVWSLAETRDPRWTPAHERRLELVLERLRPQVERAPVLADAFAALDREPALRAALGTALLAHAVDLLDAIAPAA